jgi:hypothetical protein
LSGDNSIIHELQSNDIFEDDELGNSSRGTGGTDKFLSIGTTAGYPYCLGETGLDRLSQPVKLVPNRLDRLSKLVKSVLIREAQKFLSWSVLKQMGVKTVLSIRARSRSSVLMNFWLNI